MAEAFFAVFELISIQDKTNIVDWFRSTTFKWDDFVWCENINVHKNSNEAIGIARKK